MPQPSHVARVIACSRRCIVRSRGTVVGESPHRTRVALAALASAVAMALVADARAAASSFTWTGEGASSSGWSDTANWEGAVAPSGTVETLTFPALRSPACMAESATHTCYTSNNDVSALDVEKISIVAEDAEEIKADYTLTSEAITLGAGGIEGFLSGRLSEFGMRLDAPITLSAAQQWSLVNEGEGGDNPLHIDADVSGAPADTLDMSANEGGGEFDVDGNIETGAITAGGKSVVFLGEKGSEGDFLNATDEQPVTVGAEALLVAFEGETGALTVEGALSVGNGSEVGTLFVAGGAAFTPASTLLSYIRHAGAVAGTDYSQMKASSAVELGGAGLRLEDGFTGKEPVHCEALTPGDVDTLIEATGSLTGTFTGVPNGATVTVQCDPQEEAPTVRINYTEHTVTATVETAGSGEKPTGGTPPPGEGEKHEAQTSGATQSTTLPAALPVPVSPVPVLAHTGDLAPVSGQVLVRAPGTSTFVALSSLRSIPFGTVVDAIHGSVAVTTVGANGATQTITVSEGEFVLSQGRSGMVVARLVGGDFSVCPTAHERAHAARSASKHAAGRHVVRKLWAEGHGNFTTEGNYASASVRGTKWLTEDLCEGTLIHVATDRVAVINRVNHRHLIVKAGHSYLAKAP
jgi:hypothetical protein